MSHISKVSKTIDVFVVGGREFLTEGEAKAYEQELYGRLKHTYFTLSHTPDLTEGRGYHRTDYLAVVGENASASAVIAYALEHHGPAVVDFYGRPTSGWSFTKHERFVGLDDLEAWLKGKALITIDGWGKVVEA